MKVEAGKRYQLSRYDGLPAAEGVVGTDRFGVFLFAPDGSAFTYLIEPDGTCFGIGRLHEIACPATLPPSFGSDASELSRLQERFKTWDFRWGT